MNKEKKREMSQQYVQISASTASSQTHGQLDIIIVAGKQRWISLPVSYALSVQPVADCAAAAPEPPARQLPWTSRGAGHGFLIARSATVLSIAFAPRSGQASTAGTLGWFQPNKSSGVRISFRKQTVNHNQDSER